MVGIDFQRGEQESLAGRFVTTAFGLDCHEYSIDLRQSSWVVALQNPAFSRGIVLVENAQVYGLLPVWTSPAPRLERARPFQFCLLVEIVRIEDQRLASGIEDS